MAANTLVVKQTGSFCLLYAVINALPDNQARRTFLRNNDNTLTTKNFENYFINHPHFKKKELDAEDSENDSEDSEDEDPYYHGLTSLHIVLWLKYLKRERVITSFTYKKLGNNLQARYEILRKIIDGEPQNRGHAFIVSGYHTTHEDVLRKVKNRIRNKKNKKNNRKRELNSDEPIHPVMLMFRYTKDVVKCESAKVDDEDKSCHAVCLKVDYIGNCWLYDPGKSTVKLISKKPQLFDEFIHSLFDVYLVHKIKVGFD